MPDKDGVVIEEQAEPSTNQSVIVVNSLVARGSVGGRADILALERLGFPVIFLPTLVLPWHPGHGHATRLEPDAATFAALVDDIAGAAWLGEVGAVLTGYFGHAGEVAPPPTWFPRSRRRTLRPSTSATRSSATPAASSSPRRWPLPFAIACCRWPISPRPTASSSAGLPALSDSIAAARRLGPREVIVTSATTHADLIDTLVAAPVGTFRIAHRLVPDNTVHGTGDLFAALYLGHRLDGATPEDAAARATSAVCSMVEMASWEGLDEMPLAAGQDAIAAPASGVTIEKLPD